MATATDQGARFPPWEDWMVAPNPQLVAWSRIKGIHSSHTTLGRVVGGSKWDHELQLCVVWQHEKLAILISPNLKSPLCVEKGPSGSLPQPNSAGLLCLCTTDLQFLETGACCFSWLGGWKDARYKGGKQLAMLFTL